MILDDTASCLNWSPRAFIWNWRLRCCLILLPIDQMGDEVSYKPSELQSLLLLLTIDWTCPTLRHRFLLARRLGSKDTPRTFLLDLDLIVAYPWMISTTCIPAGRRRCVDDVHDILQPTFSVAFALFPGPGALWEKRAYSFGLSTGTRLESPSAFCCPGAGRRGHGSATYGPSNHGALH